MSDISTRTATSAKSKASKETSTSRGFQFPQFEMSGLELPEGFREMASQWMSEGKSNFERALMTAEEMNSVCGNACTTAAKYTAEYATKITEMMHKNTAATFDLVKDAVTAKSLPEMIEVSLADTRKQFDALATQTQELWSLAQKMAVETTRPLTADLPKVFQAPPTSA